MIAVGSGRATLRARYNETYRIGRGSRLLRRGATFPVAGFVDAPTSEIEVRVLPSAETCRSDQPPKFAELAVIEMPPRQISLPSRFEPGSSSFRTSSR